MIFEKMEELFFKLSKIKWFSASGNFHEVVGRKPIRNLAAWDNDVFSKSIDAYHADIAAKMDWLPTSKDQVDPFNEDQLRNRLKEKGGEASGKVLEFCKIAMKSLRNVDRSKFISGPHDYSEAAIGGALYCSRMAVIEVVLEQPAIWNEIFDLYYVGYWPCGLLPGGDIVVY